MPRLPFPRCTRPLAALTAGLLLLSTPVAAADTPERVPAVTAPAPLEQVADPSLNYRAALEQLTALGLARDQADWLWSSLGVRLNQLLDQAALAQETLDLLFLPNAQGDLLERYQAHAARFPDLPREQAVLEVNMGLDQPFYTNPVTADDPDSLTVLVNKYRVLPADYVPELEVLGTGYGKGSLRPEAAAQFRAMADAAREEGITLTSVSAYRSYATQRTLYRNYCAQYAQSLVDTFSARPGHSEHQTGLALDINTASTSAHFENTPEFAWLQENCARFGFLLRYPAGKEAITGYRFEPWHYRYVGVDLAQTCTEQGLTYEEYIAALPAQGDNQPPALTLDGTSLQGTEALRLEGFLYLSPFRLAQTLGWSAAQEDGAVTLDLEDHTLTLLAGRTGLRDKGLLRHAFPALNLDGVLYLRLEDLAAALNRQVEETEADLALTLPAPELPITG